MLGIDWNHPLDPNKASIGYENKGPMYLVNDGGLMRWKGGVDTYVYYPGRSFGNFSNPMILRPNEYYFTLYG